MAKRMRRRLGVWALLAGVVVLLILLGAPGRPGPGGPSPNPGDRAPSPPAGRRTGPDEAPPPDQPPSAARAGERDRVRGLLHVARTALAEGRPGAALAVHDRLAVLGPLTPDLDGERARARRAAELALETAVRRLGELVREGRILEARARLEALRSAPHPRVRRALEDLARSRGWPWAELLAGRRPQVVDEPAPAPLARGREVRARYRGALRRGWVVSSQGDSVAVRLRTEHGDVFPMLDRVAVQPVGPSRAEVTGQIRAARRAGDVWLEALWRAYAVEVGAPASGRLPKTSSTPPIDKAPATRESGQRSREK